MSFGMSYEGPFQGAQASHGTATIRRRWLRGKHWVFLLLCMGMSIGLLSLWAAQGLSGWSVVATLFVLSWDYTVTTMFVNTTTIQGDAAGVKVTYGPLPSLFGLKQTLARANLKQLFTAKFGSMFAVKAQLTDGNEVYLVRPLISAEQALFVEQQLEKVLGLADFAVEGELGSDALTLQGDPVKGGASGALLGLLIPVFIGGTITLFYFMARSEVTGALEASAPLGSWSFQPDDCASGQHEGFGGVTLTSEKSPGRAVRVVMDPIKGMLVVAITPGQKNQVFDDEQCRVFHVQVERSNTNINDVWGMQGKTNLECPGLRGAVSYAGCY